MSRTALMDIVSMGIVMTVVAVLAPLIFDYFTTHVFVLNMK